MSRTGYKSHGLIDNALALRLLLILTTPFEQFPAFKSGVIDKKGRYIIPKSKRTPAQKRSLTYLDRLMINVKKIINKLPGGENKLKNLVAAMFLIKESLNGVDGQTILEDYENEQLYERQKKVFHDSAKKCLMIREMVCSSAIAANSTSNIATYSKPMFKRVIRRFNDRLDQDL